jgi:hypothetical protein
MVQAAIKSRGDGPHIRRAERRQSPHNLRQIRFNRGLSTEGERLGNFWVAPTLPMAAGAASIVTLAFFLSLAPRCTASVSTPTIFIGGVIKVAGC